MEEKYITMRERLGIDKRKALQLEDIARNCAVLDIESGKILASLIRTTQDKNELAYICYCFGWEMRNKK